MRIVKSFRFRVYPSAAQVERIGRWEDALRFLWNLAHEQRLMGLSRPRDERRFPTTFDQQRELTALRAELPWLADVPRDVCAQLLAVLDDAWRRCFNGIARTPHWKRKGVDPMSLCEPHPKAWWLDGSVLYFPKLGEIRAVAHRPIEGIPKTCTIKRDGDQWFASIVCQIEVADPTPRTAPIVAIDRGIANFGATSDGDMIANPEHFKSSLRSLARTQRTVDRRKKGSKNREKAKARVARIYRKVRRQRGHFLHVQSARLAKSHGVVVLEKLSVAGLMRGKCSQSVSAAGWSRFAYMLRYKLAWSGGTLVEVPAAYSSQTCGECGCVDAKSRRSQSAFVCTSCGHRDHADLNAAKILLGRANRSASMPVEGTGSNRPLRSGKRVALRATRKACPLAVLITR